MKPTDGASAAGNRYLLRARRPRGAGPRLACVVTKKQRRRQVAHASAQRRAVRLAAREARRRRRRIVLTALLVLVALTGLVLWIVTHDANDTTAVAGPGTSPVAAVPTLNEVPR